MTRLIKGIIGLIVTRKRHAAQTDQLFWQALLAVHREYFVSALIEYGQAGRPHWHIYHQLCTLECWLDIAIEEGWISEDQPGE